MKCMDCEHCIEDFVMIATLNKNILRGTDQFYCQIQNQLHYIGDIAQLPNKRCMFQKCIKCNQPDPRISSGSGYRVFCQKCLDEIPKEPEEQFDISKIMWSQIIEKR